MSDDATNTFTRLNGFKLALARGVCIAIIALSAVLFCLSIPARYQQLQTVCVGAECESDNARVSEAGVATLDRLGISLRSYALYLLAVEIVVTLVGWAIAVLILMRKSDDPMALLVAVWLALGTLAADTLNALPAALPSLWLPVTLVKFVGYTTLILVFYLFPNGRFVPKWTLWLWLILCVNEFIYDFWPAAPFKTQGWYGLFVGWIWIVSFIAIVVTQIYRYRHVSNAIERLQTKWVVLGLSIGIVGALALLLPGLIFGIAQSSLFRVLFATISPLLLSLVPISFGIAILRYRLWNIDVIIRRTLIYGVLSGLLLLIYFGIVVITLTLVAALGPMIGSSFGPPPSAIDATALQEQSQLPLTIATLAIAALFLPLRRAVQNAIDRRFYRRKYDAEKTIAALSARIQNEVDVDHVTGELMDVVDETLQPVHMSLWLKTATADRRPRSVESEMRP